MERIRVCLLVDTVAYDAGTERQVSETISRMDPSRFDVYLCCFEDSARLRQLGLKHHTAVFPLTRLYSPNGLLELMRFRRYLRRHRFDIVHAYMVKTSIFGVLGALGTPCPVVITSRLNMGYWYTPLYVRIFRWINRHTTRIFANSEAAARVAIEMEGLPPEKVDVVYQGVDIKRFAGGNAAAVPVAGIPERARVVGMIANLRPVKDISLFLRAAQIVAAEIPDAAFLIVGQGPQRGELAELAAELGISGKVFFSDGRGSVPDYLARMSVGCLSSHSEGLSNAILEYMAAGLPVVATNVGGNAEAVADGNTGYLVRDRTTGAFAAPIIELLSNEDHRLTMGRRSLERCREHFAIDVTIRRLEDYYTTLIEAR